MKVSLTDFDPQPLQTLLNLVVAKIVEEDQHKKEWIKAFMGTDESFANAWYDSNCRPLRDVNYEHLCLWRAQILNSIGKVGVREIVESN